MIKKAINTLEAGMVKNDNKLKQPENSYSFALNTIPNNILSDRHTKVNEYGFSTNINLGKLFILINAQWLGTDEYVLFIKNPNYSSNQFNEIWLYNFKTLDNRLLYSNNGLNFSTVSSMVSTYRIDYKGNRLVYFVDGFNDDRVINIDNPDTVNLNVTSLSLNADVELNQPLATIINGEGYIKAGQYFIGVSYVDDTNYETQLSSFTRGISITNKNHSIPESEQYNPFYYNEFANINGTIANTVTNKAINIKINDIDSRYTSINIYIIQVLNEETIIRTIRDVKVYGENIEFLYTGFEGEEDTSVTLNDLLVSRVNYYASEIINQKDNRLIRGNTKIKSDTINYQRFANNIKVTYDIQEETFGYYGGYTSVGGTHANANNRTIIDNTIKLHSINPDYLTNAGDSTKISYTFMRDEVYSLGVSLELKDGSESAVFHIPGRAVNTFVDSSIATRLDESGATNSGSLSAIWDTREVFGIEEPMWKVSNTAAKKNDVVGNTALNELAYWRSDETYPDGYDFPTNGELDPNGKSYVRHHRMPSDRLEPLYRTQVVFEGTDSTQIVYVRRNIVLNLENIVIPDEYKDIVNKVKIHYTPRNNNNRKVVTKGLVYNTGNVTMSTPGSVPNVRPGYMFNSFGRGSDALINKNILQFISPEIDFNFKQFPILGNNLKVLGAVKGYSIMHGARGTIALPPPFPAGSRFNAVGIINRELATYDVGGGDDASEGFLQEFYPMSIMYNMYQPYKPFSQSGIYDIDNINFIDPDYEGSFSGQSVNFRGEDPTVLLSLPVSQELYLNPLNYPDLNLNADGRIIFPNINFNGGLGSGPIASAHIVSAKYYDSALYCSILRDLPRQYGNPLTLQYVFTGNSSPNLGIPISVTVNNGDSVIESHSTRKGYSALMPDLPNYEGLQSGSTIDNEGDIKFYQTTRQVQEVKTNSYITYITETDLNIRMRRNPLENEGEEYYPSFAFSNPSLNALEKKTLTREFYKIEDFYNTKYLNVNFANNKKIEEFETESDFRYKTRLVYSDKQGFEDKKDHYRLTRPNNYRDIPMNRGPITQSFIKDNKMFILTRDALFDVYSSSNNLQVLDSTNITVGTGEFFGLEPIEIMPIQGGFGGTSSKLSLNESPYGYLYVDRQKNKSILFNTGLDDINMAGLEENFTLDLVNQINDLEIDNELDCIGRGIGVISGYDANLKRLLITKKDYYARQSILNRYKGRFDNDQSYSVGDIVAKDGELVEISGEITEGPDVYAGEDQFGVLGSTILEGVVTPGTSPIATILWTQISGPSTASFLDNTNPITQVSNLLDGEYIFRLTATDTASLSAYDEVKITSDLEMIYYDFNTTGNIPTIGQILDGVPIQTIPTGDIEVPFQELDNDAPRYFWMAYKESTDSKDKWRDKFNIFNSGNIIDDQDLFEEKGIVSGYKVIMTNYPTQFINPIIFYK